MKSLLRRLERIEAIEAVMPERRSDPGLDDQIMRMVDAQLSEEDHELCQSLGQRRDFNGEFTACEDRALAAFHCALKLECKRAGYRSVDEFESSYLGASRTPAGPFRRYRHK